jgi:NADPH:quinone reductase-like Zn-dependent oxidoreductase
VDVILDLVGAAYLSANLASLAVRGRLIVVGLVSGTRGELDLSALLQKRATLIGTVLRTRSAEEKIEATTRCVNDVWPLFERATVKPVVDRVFPMAEAQEAYRYLASNKSFGKVILDLSL